MFQNAPANSKKKSRTDEIFDPTADITTKTGQIIDRELPQEAGLGSIVVPTLPLEQRRRAASTLLAAVCRGETVEALVSISGNIGIQQETILRSRIAIGGHFQAIYHAIQKDVLSDGDVSPNRQKLALQLTYDYIQAIHGYVRAVARNHMLVYQQFARNEEAVRILSYSEMLLLAESIKSEDDRILLLEEKREFNMTQVEFKARIREYALKLKQAHEQIAQMSSAVAQSEGDFFLKSSEYTRLEGVNAALERSLEDAQKKSQLIEESRAELANRLLAVRQDAEKARERVDALENEARAFRAERDSARVNLAGRDSVREVEVLPQDYTLKRDALAAAEKALSERASELQQLESAAAAREEELTRAEENLKESRKLLATSDALKELISSFGQFHTAYVTAQIKVSAVGAPAQFRDVLLELDSKMEAMRLEVQAAAARGA